jgi:hypothetical protein
MATSVRAIMQKRRLESKEEGRLLQSNAQGGFTLEVQLGQTTPTTEGSLADSSSSRAGATAGAVMGGVGAILVAAGLIFFLFMRNKKRKAKRDEEITKDQTLKASHAGLME